MKINHCLILAAGFGTRMGKIGTTLPKVLWPVFEKPLIELQILYAKRLGIKNIFINVHHQREQIVEFIDQLNDSDIRILVEEEILDIGGAIHNLACQEDINYSGNLLILNSDQFLFFDEEYLTKAIHSLKSYQASLFAIRVNKEGKYNQINFSSEGKLTGITQFNDVKEFEYWTYSGCGIINLDKLDPVSGKSKFFESVSPYQKCPIKIIALDELHYWDFGTLPRYVQSMRLIMSYYHERISEPFIDFLIEEGALQTTKIRNSSYNSQIENVINLNKTNLNVFPGSIILGEAESNLQNGPVIAYKNVYESLSDL